MSAQKWFLGKRYDLDAGQMLDEIVWYDPDDLTTHAFIVGMTGSGKTGLAITLLEEAALGKVPALLIDPKGDLTNIGLHFPELRPEDFAPWVSPDEARREGKTVEQKARELAELWRKGLASWGIGPDRIRQLAESVAFTIFTPGSDAGVPISILASLAAPKMPWEGNQELILERINGTVTALLGLVGLDDVDPLQSREHILLANIFRHAWSQGRDLTLADLILQVQNPPFDKLGVFDLETFFPTKDRMALAMRLNNILAAPTFQPWLQGVPLDIPSLLWTPEGKPRHSVFYLAHLSDRERMFFVTLLFAAVETWMRTQPGSDALRALLYFDEIYGYLPPTANPPSKPPLLRMLKQARAFGLGLVLVTQNPVDIDYKALSNAGTWFIGRLQTERDKQRLLDGLEGAAPGMDRRAYDDLISRLRKRVFLLHNVHEREPIVYHTRWAMNYLPGPLTRAQIPALNRLLGVTEPATHTTAEPAVTPTTPRAAETTTRSKPAGSPTPAMAELPGTPTRPRVPGEEYFWPVEVPESRAAREAGIEGAYLGLVYRPALWAQARVTVVRPKYNLEWETLFAALVEEPSRRVDWDAWRAQPHEPDFFDPEPVPEAHFLPLEPPWTRASDLKRLRSSFQSFVARQVRVPVRLHKRLKVYAGPEVSESRFKRLLREAARQGLEKDLEKVRQKYRRKLERLRTKLAREERELAQEMAEYEQRKQEEWATHAENILGLFLGRRRRLTTSLTKRRMTKQVLADIEESKQAIADYKAQIEALEAEMNEAMEDVRAKWAELLEDVETLWVRPYKREVEVEMFGIAWMPFHVYDTEDGLVDVPAFHEPHEVDA
ncbi:MAG: DUF87 domain-containing protein [Chloroflexi bacterium]|nr:DUF87 domain-containing protein [Chloroflexota bacterium]